VKSEPRLGRSPTRSRRARRHELERGAQPCRKLNLMAMKVGEEAFFYHSNEGKAIVGIVAVSKPYYRTRPTTAAASAWSTSRRPRARAAGDARGDQGDKRLAKMILVVNSRLSVQPVTARNGAPRSRWRRPEAAKPKT